MIVLCILVLRVKLVKRLSELHQSGELEKSQDTITASSKVIIALNIAVTIVFLLMATLLIILKRPLYDIITNRAYSGIFCT